MRGQVRRPVRRQRPVPGGRQALPACVLRELHRIVDREARHFGVSRSFVVALALGEAFGVDVESYKPALRVVRRRA